MVSEKRKAVVQARNKVNDQAVEHNMEICGMRGVACCGDRCACWDRVAVAPDGSGGGQCALRSVGEAASILLQVYGPRISEDYRSQGGVNGEQQNTDRQADQETTG